MTISKTDYLEYRECKKNAWVRKHKPEIYKKFPPSDFDKLLMKSGQEVEAVARRLFPNGLLVKGLDAIAQATTLSYIENKQSVIFQAVFQHGGILAATDVLEYDADALAYNLYEVKSKNSIDKKTNYHDAAFQVNLLNNCGIKVNKVFIIHLNKEYIRFKDLDIQNLFTIADITEEVNKILEEVALETVSALKYLSQDELPKGNCQCVYKGRNGHCTAFGHINPDIAKYSVHDIARIGSSKKKLADLIDRNIFLIDEILDATNFSDIQQNQIHVHKTGTKIIDKEAIAKELNSLRFPLYFIDYETFDAALPRYDGHAPYTQIPFQFALYVLDSPDAEPRLLEFIHSDTDNPDKHFVNAMKEHLGNEGHVIVWSSFEESRNKELAERIPEMYDFLMSINNRIYDLIEIFSKQYYVDKDFLGKTSIKNIMPILAPHLSYKELAIQDGGAASTMWNRLYTEDLSKDERENIINSLKKYCGLDAYAMYAIWKVLHTLVN